jgi:signal peptidase I
MSSIRRGLDLILLLLVAAVLVVGLVAFLAPAVGGRALAIRSGSMTPAIGVGSLVLVVPQDPATLEVGDVVAITLPSGTVLTHRVEAIVQQDDRRMFRLRGDANPAPDATLTTQDQLLGKVVVAAPGLGYLLAMMTIRLGQIALVLLASQLLVGAWLLDELGTRRAKHRDQLRGRRTVRPGRGIEVSR